MSRLQKPYEQPAATHSIVFATETHFSGAIACNWEVQWPVIFRLASFYSWVPASGRFSGRVYLVCRIRAYSGRFPNAMVWPKNGYVAGSWIAVPSQHDVFRNPTRQLHFNLFCTREGLSESIWERSRIGFRRHRIAYCSRSNRGTAGATEKLVAVWTLAHPFRQESWWN